MAQYLSNELAGTTTGTTETAATGYRPSASVYGARSKVIRATIAFASQADGSTIVLGVAPVGYSFSHGVITVGTSTSTATLAIGTAASAAKYKAAGAHTTTDAPALFGKAAAIAAAPYSAEETIIATVGTAALPSSGTAVIELFFNAAS